VGQDLFARATQFADPVCVCDVIQKHVVTRPILQAFAGISVRRACRSCLLLLFRGMSCFGLAVYHGNRETRLRSSLRFWLGSVFSFGLLAYPFSNVLAQMPAQGHINSWYNPDESPKIALEFGGGYDASLGNARQVQNGGWNFLLGGGYNFNRRWSTLLEYGFNHFHAPESELTAFYGQGAGVVGHTHIWKVTVDPSYRFHATEHYGFYVLGGGGFFRKTMEFNSTEPSYTLGTSAYTFPGSNNAGGVEGGLGVSKRPGLYNNARFFAEVRYVWVDNKPSIPSNQQLYPGLYGQTHYMPVTAGFRW
jgi:hypothetical protein